MGPFGTARFVGRFFVSYEGGGQSNSEAELGQMTVIQVVLQGMQNFAQQLREVRSPILSALAGLHEDQMSLLLATIQPVERDLLYHYGYSSGGAMRATTYSP